MTFTAKLLDKGRILREVPFNHANERLAFQRAKRWSNDGDTAYVTSEGRIWAVYQGGRKLTVETI